MERVPYSLPTLPFICMIFVHQQSSKPLSPLKRSGKMVGDNKLSLCLVFFFLFFFFSSHRRSISEQSDQNVVNVDDYGARGDGISDDSLAFEEAWGAACTWNSDSVVYVPQKKYLLKPIVFSGPCKSSVTMMGTLEASSDPSDWDLKDRRYWLLFNGVNHLNVGGGGLILGNGQIWWQNSCKANRTLPCMVAPTALTFTYCNELRVENLRMRDSQQIHLSFEDCSSVEASNLTITAPETSPNTDGIHVTRTTKMGITRCTIQTGDDCISIVNGSQSIKVQNIVCGPGHGISIGSLGIDNSKGYVSNVLVKHAILTGTTNGVRIKTWQGGYGLVDEIKFQDIVVHNVSNPIIIDQNYCDSVHPCQEQKSAVEVMNVEYKNIRGTSASRVAMKFECSRSVPCSGILLENIDLESENEDTTRSLCENISWTQLGNVVPSCH